MDKGRKALEDRILIAVADQIEGRKRRPIAFGARGFHIQTSRCGSRTGNARTMTASTTA
jgi:hypothetical protein